MTAGPRERWHMDVLGNLDALVGSAFAVVCGRHGEVAGHARESGCSRQSVYRRAEKVVEAVTGSDAAAARIAEPEARLAQRDAEIAELRARPPAMSAGRQAEFAVTAQ